MIRSGVYLAILVLLGSICFSTASRAEGFFETLFGFSRQHVESHAAYINAPLQLRHHAAHRHRFAAHHKKATHFALRAHSRHHKAFAHHKAIPAASGDQLGYAAVPTSIAAPVEEKKCCSNAQDAIAKVMHEDRTLRPGDAYMSADGLRVFEGERATDQEFVPVGQTRALDEHSKARLAAVEKTPVTDIEPSLKSRSAQISSSHAGLAPDQKPTKLNKERFIKTLNGKTIRFVGGYAS
jgi:hypothetical protein